MLSQFKQAHWPIFILSSASSFANLFLPIILVRLLTPNQIGYYKIYFIYLGLLPYLFFTSSPIHSVYYWAGYKNESKRYKYIQSSWHLSFIFSAILLLIGVLFTSIISKHVNLSTLHIRLLFISVFLWIPSNHFAESSIALGRSVSGALYTAFFDMAKVITFILIVYYTRQIINIFYAYFILLSLKFLLTIILGQKNNFIKFNFDFNSIKDVFRYCLPISISSLLNIILEKVDLLILTALLIPQNFAFYSMGCLIVPPLLLLHTSVIKILIPKLSTYYANKESELALIEYKNAIASIAHLIIPASIGLYFFADQIISFLYTSKYISSAAYLKIFAFSYLISCIPGDSVLRATGHTSLILKMYLITTPISLISAYLIAKNYGALYTLSFSILIKAIPQFTGMIYSAKIMNWKIIDMIPYKRLMQYLIISLFLVAACSIFKSYFNSSKNWFFICTPIFAILYIYITIYITRILNERRDQL